MPLVVQDFIGSIVKLAPLPKACDGHHRHLTRPSAIMKIDWGNKEARRDGPSELPKTTLRLQTIPEAASKKSATTLGSYAQICGVIRVLRRATGLVDKSNETLARLQIINDQVSHLSIRNLASSHGRHSPKSQRLWWWQFAGSANDGKDSACGGDLPGEPHSR
jgi:hypothetical protein